LGQCCSGTLTASIYLFAVRSFYLRHLSTSVPP
jgi:hypothetical protein